MGQVGCFVPAEGLGEFERGMQVVVRSERGRETGTILCQGAQLQWPAGLAHTPGIILGRHFEESATDREAHAALAQDRFHDAQHFLHSLFLPIQLIDVEVFTDPAHVVLHVLKVGEVDVLRVQKQLQDRWKVSVAIHDMTCPEALEEAVDSGCGSCSSGGGCGTGGCGSGGGCATGGCQHGDATPGSFDRDWRAYFAELRSGMEQRSTVRPGV